METGITTTHVDVVVIGGGPAGGQCARTLAQLGRQVLLVERVANFSQHNFSSAGTAFGVLKEFALPMSVVGRTWNIFEVITSHQRLIAVPGQTGTDPNGIVFAFDKLRQFLADETQRLGGRVWMGHVFQKYEIRDDGVHVWVQEEEHHRDIEIITKIVVDATGSQRSVINALQQTPSHVPEVHAVGMEYLIEVDPAERDKISWDSLQLFFGNTWMPHGYSWSFPMDGNTVKIGACRVMTKDEASLPPMSDFADRLIHDFFKLEHYQILDTHGGFVRSHLPKDDVFVRGTSIVAIGDAVSCVNLIFGEGVKHGMSSGQQAAIRIDEFLRGEANALKAYERDMKRYFNWRWPASFRLAQLLYVWTNEWQQEFLLWLAVAIGAKLVAKLWQSLPTPPPKADLTR